MNYSAWLRQRLLLNESLQLITAEEDYKHPVKKLGVIIKYLPTIENTEDEFKRFEKSTKVLKELPDIQIIEREKTLSKFFTEFFNLAKKKTLLFILSVLLQTVTFQIHPEIYQLFEERLNLKKRIRDTAQEFVSHIPFSFSDYCLISVFLRDEIYERPEIMNLLIKKIVFNGKSKRFIATYINSRDNIDEYIKINIIPYANSIQVFSNKIKILLGIINSLDVKKKIELYELITQRAIDLTLKETDEETNLFELASPWMGQYPKQEQKLSFLELFLEEKWQFSIPIHKYEEFKQILTKKTKTKEEPFGRDLFGYERFSNHSIVDKSLKEPEKKIISRFLKKNPESYRMFWDCGYDFYKCQFIHPNFIDNTLCHKFMQIMDYFVNFFSPLLEMKKDKETFFSHLPFEIIAEIFKFFSEQKFDIHEDGPSKLKIKTFCNSKIYKDNEVYENRGVTDIQESSDKNGYWFTFFVRI